MFVFSQIHYMKNLLIKSMMVILVFMIFFPIVPLFFSIFSPVTENFEYIVDMFLWDHTITTISLIVCVAFFSFIISISTSILITFYEFPFSKIFYFLLILPLTIPTYFGAYIYDKVFDYSGIINTSIRNIFGINHLLSFDLFSFFGGVLIFTIFLFPYLFIVLMSFFRKNIAELLEVARTLGTSNYKIIFKIILPLAKLPVMTGLSMIIMEVINDFGVTSYLGIQTFTASIFKAWFSMNDLVTASKLSGYLIPVIFLLLLLGNQYSLKKNIDFSNTRTPNAIKLTGLKRYIATLFCGFIFFISYLLPLILFVYYSYFAFIEYPIWDLVILLGQTIILIIVTTLTLLILGVFFAYQNRNNTYTIHAELFSLQYALPSIIIAVSIISVFLNLESFHILPQGATTYIQNAFVLLIFAYTMRFIIISYNLSLNTFKKIGIQYQQISQTLGYSKFQAFLKLELPLILPSLIIGSSIIVIDLFKELPLTLFLSPFNFETPSTRTYNYVANEMFVEATPSALVLIIILGIITYLLYYYSIFNKGNKS